MVAALEEEKTTKAPQLSLASWGERVLGMCCSIVAVLGLAIYSRPDHPIWLDEMLHFALAGSATVGEAIHTIRASILSVNFNQTGVYMLIDVLLLKTIGASAFALRLPSLLSTVWLLICTLSLFGARGFGNIWKLAAVFAVVASSSLMYYAAEARPYIPLAAAAVGTLTYYVALERTSFICVLGYASVALGAAIHPYYPGYFVAVAAVGMLSAAIDGRLSFRWRAIIAFLNMRLFFFCIIIYFAVGALSWMRGGPHLLHLNPFQWVSRDSIVENLLTEHLHMFYDYGPPFQTEMALGEILIGITVVTACSAIKLNRTRPTLALFAPAALIMGSLILSGTLSWISYLHDYWILQRQWIASFALTPVGMVWWFAELGRQVDKFLPRLSWMLALSVIYICGFSFFNGSADSRSAIHDDITKVNNGIVLKNQPSAPPSCGDRDAWVSIANDNIAAGGPVWPVLAKFYNCPGNS